MAIRPPNVGTFHEVGKLFPEEVSPVTVTPETTVRQALRLMQANRYSQLPVVSDGELRGIFSLWSLARLVEQVSSSKLDPLDIPVEDAMEWVPTVTVHDTLDSVMSRLEEHETLVVNSPHGIQAVATPVDVLRYFYRIAKPFVLIQEIELSLRALISVCARGSELDACIDRSLRAKYESWKKPVPRTLEDMTFEDYRSIITSKDNWPVFEGTLGQNRLLAASKLERIRDLRNAVFHFRDELSVLDYQTLVAERNWLLDKTRHAALRRGEDRNG